MNQFHRCLLTALTVTTVAVVAPPSSARADVSIEETFDLHRSVNPGEFQTLILSGNVFSASWAQPGGLQKIKGEYVVRLEAVDDLPRRTIAFDTIKEIFAYEPVRDEKGQVTGVTLTRLVITPNGKAQPGQPFTLIKRPPITSESNLE
jgi:hypothetical protein